MGGRMTRRTLLRETEQLLLSQRRGVPNVRLWSESPTPPVVEWDGEITDGTTIEVVVE
jgi:hypothetical protein